MLEMIETACIIVTERYIFASFDCFDYLNLRHIIMNFTYLTTEELSAKIKYAARSIRHTLMDTVFFEGRHYIRPFGGQAGKILFLWENIESDMLKQAGIDEIPLANGGFVNGTR
jgi:hypothetical protein